MAGRKPLPTKLHVLNGNPSHLDLTTRAAREPKPRPRVPKCPPHLNRDAKMEWDRLVPELDELGLLTNLDRGVLVMYCQAWSDYLKAARKLKKDGSIVVTPNGYPVPSPWFQIQKTALDQLNKAAAQFGLSPSARSRIQVPEKDQDQDDFEKTLD